MTIETWLDTNIIFFLFMIIAVTLWAAIWKIVALWKSARNNQLPWFIIMAIFNTAGILPILYICLFQKKPIKQCS